jgi:hypothetical protein
MEVEGLKRFFFSFFVLAFIFTINVTVLADEGHTDNNSIKEAAKKFTNGTDNSQEHSDNHHGDQPLTSSDSSNEDHHDEEGSHEKGMHSEDEDHHSTGAAEDGSHGKSTHSESGENHSTGTTEGGHEEGGHSEDEDSHSTGATEDGHEEDSGGHHGPVVETPPNYKILGTYGAVNLSFILIGIWNKWFRRRGEQ